MLDLVKLYNKKTQKVGFPISRESALIFLANEVNEKEYSLVELTDNENEQELKNEQKAPRATKKPLRTAQEDSNYPTSVENASIELQKKTEV